MAIVNGAEATADVTIAVGVIAVAAGTTGTAIAVRTIGAKAIAVTTMVGGIRSQLLALARSSAIL